MSTTISNGHTYHLTELADLSLSFSCGQNKICNVILLSIVTEMHARFPRTYASDIASNLDPMTNISHSSPPPSSVLQVIPKVINLCQSSAVTSLQTLWIKLLFWNDLAPKPP